MSRHASVVTVTTLITIGLAIICKPVRPEVTSSSPPSDEVITPRCPERCACDAARRVVDCRARNLTDLAEILAQLDPATTDVLDLRANRIATIRSRAFVDFVNLSVILLDDNVIEDVEPNAFKGLTNIRVLSLTGNRLTTIRGNAFAEIVGATSCSNDNSSNIIINKTATPLPSSSRWCGGLDLTNNDIRSIDRHAFAWIRQLPVSLGHGRSALTVDAYAFYGARSVRRVRIGGVPALTLKPRLFTNAEDIGVVEIADTAVGSLDGFLFEGLKNVECITMNNVSVDSVRSFAFSGVHFRRRPATSAGETSSGEDGNDVNDDANAVPSRSRRRKSHHVQRRRAESGGLVSFVGCRLQLIETDAFRDTNVAHIAISSSVIGRIAPRAFQSVVGLTTLSISGCHFESGRLTTDSMASVRGLRALRLTDNDFRVVEPFAFRDVTDVDEIHIQFRSDSSATIMTEAFGHVSEVDQLQLSGGMTSRSLRDNNNKDGDDDGGSGTLLVVDVGAFRNLVGVGVLRMADFRFPVVTRHSFAGLSRVANLTIADCGVLAVEREAFGEMTSHVGVVEHLDIGTGNRLRCNDCAMHRELELRFVDYVAYCTRHSTDGGTDDNELIDIHQMSLHETCSSSSAATRTRTIPWLMAASTLFIAGLFRAAAARIR